MNNKMNHPLITVDGRTLMDRPLEPPNFVVDTLISQGLHILAGSPKVGKSWLALWLAVTVAKGEPVWNMTTKQGTTLYLCLEDSVLRIQNRLFEITEDAPSSVHFCTECALIGQGLEEQVDAFLAAHPDTVLVIIDTLQMVRPVHDATYANDYRDLSVLKRLADKHGIAILLIHHLRKEKAEDVFHRISGTTAISGAVDSSFTLVEEKRGSDRARLTCVGRDIEYRELELRRSEENPIRNWANELHAKDTSKKVRAIKKMQAERGERLGGKPPYGYKKKDKDSKEIIPDEETAPIVRRIFDLCAAGKGPNQIARILTQAQVLNPTNQYYQATGAACTNLDTTRPYTWSGRTVAKILENKVYIGHTLNMKKTTLSYKNKKQIQKPESEQILVENTHEPLISMEVWEIVQDVREHKRRPPKHMEEPNLFSGLVYCADCGKYMVLCRTEEMREDQYYFRCSTYSKRGKTACSPHQIREADLKAIVLDDLRRVTHFARMKERQFAQYINQRNTAELRREINRLQRELDSMHRRYDELSVLFKRLYEDNVLGRVSDEQFRMLSADYNAEQKNLSATIPAKEEQLEKLKASAANVDAFIEKAKRYTTIDELTPELLRLFIQRIEVGERSQKYSRSAGQSIRIVYRDIGRVDSPMQEGEHIPHITKQITDIEEIKRLLA